MSLRVRPCTECGDAIVLAKAPNGGTMPLAPYPDPAGQYRVDVLGRDLVVLRDDQVSSGKTKRYDPHSRTCMPASKAAPRAGRPTQLALEPP